MLLPSHAILAQQDSLRARRAGIATGPSFFYGAEGNTIGVHLEGSLALRINGSRTWLRTDVSSHVFGAQRLYPCLLVVQGSCYSTSRRAVFGTSVGIEHGFGGGKANATHGYYGTLGLTALVSARTAERYAECNPGSVCPDEPMTHEINNVDLGAVVGLGQSWAAGSRVFFIESRLYQPFAQRDDADPYTRFRVLPLTFGIRF
ncbi:MAG: hypothetical protein IT361_02880 [Gemmatimonadaceae bacterium]|nr:hypothetical protein [Gemmatimonadaceae bacterium]